MKKRWIPLVALTAIFVSSCQQNADKKQATDAAKNGVSAAAGTKGVIDIGKLAHSDVFIDADLKEPIEINKIPVTEIPKFKAAVYRFYTHVKLENGKYVSDLTSGKEINISEKIFNAFTKNLGDLNQQAADARKSEAARKGGGTLKMAEIDSTYLNSLLK